MYDLSALAHGFSLGLAVFIALGPKDVLILRAALDGESAAKLIAVAVISDAGLIALGIAGLSVALYQAPLLHVLGQAFGIVLLGVQGVVAARRAFGYAGNPRGSNLFPRPSGRNRAVLGILLMSILNPVVWLDTILIIGVVGAVLPAVERWSFASGAIAASLIWFTFLVMGSGLARRWMRIAAASRILDACVAVAMLGMAAYMALHLAL